MDLRILIVESKPEELLFLQDILMEMDNHRYWSDWVHLETLHAATWTEAASILLAKPIDLVLLDLNLSDSHGADTFRRSQADAADVPVILLVDPSSSHLAERLIREGAQDFQILKDVDCAPLARAIRNAIERHQLLTATRATSSTDPLTGLLNQHAFAMMADRDRILAHQLGRQMTILVAELQSEGAAQIINPQRRDLALVAAADHLRRFAAPNDLIARIDGDRFAIAKLHIGFGSDATAEQFRRAAESLGISIGTAVFDPIHPVSLDDLLFCAANNLRSKSLATVS